MPVTKSFFQRIPFLRITCFFMAGILLKHFFPSNSLLLYLIVSTILTLLFVLWSPSNYQLAKFQNTFIALSIFLVGYFYPEIKPEHHRIPEKDAYYLAEVVQKPKEKAKSFQSILEIQNDSLPKPEKILVYFSKSNYDSSLQLGDQLIIRARLQEIKNTGNPFEFDYELLMHKKGIWYSTYLSGENYLKTTIQIARSGYWAENIRESLISLLRKSVPEQQIRSVISALTLGYRTELERETINYFTSTGAMHVLAVSGLHVGLIYFILIFLFSWLKHGNIGKYVFPAVLIICLWAYAAITGFSASVQRATIMFTFIIVGNLIRRPVNIYNSISASALVLMLLEPDVIFEVGFQLSYLAVLGIVLIQPKLARLIEVKNKILKFFWDLFTVSIAAQLATFPLGIFYFNQFPNYFWISNFIVIPAATLIIWLAFAFFIFSPIPGISQLLAKLLSWTTGLMIGLLKQVSELPFALKTGLIANTFQTIIIYLLLASLFIFAVSKRKQWLTSSLILVVVLQGTFLYRKFSLINQKQVYVYNSDNNPIHFINGRKNYLLLQNQDTITETEKRMIQNVANHLKLDSAIQINLGENQKFELNDLSISGNLIQFLDCQIIYAQKYFKKSNNRDLLTFRIPELVNEKKVYTTKTITTGSPYFTEKQKISIDHSTRKDGAFSISLR